MSSPPLVKTHEFHNVGNSATSFIPNSCNPLSDCLGAGRDEEEKGEEESGRDGEGRLLKAGGQVRLARRTAEGRIERVTVASHHPCRCLLLVDDGVKAGGLSADKTIKSRTRNLLIIQVQQQQPEHVSFSLLSNPF